MAYRHNSNTLKTEFKKNSYTERVRKRIVSYNCQLILLCDCLETSKKEQTPTLIREIEKNNIAVVLPLKMAFDYLKISERSPYYDRLKSLSDKTPNIRAFVNCYQMRIKKDNILNPYEYKYVDNLAEILKELRNEK